MTRLVKLPLAQNVGPSQRVTVRCPLGVTYNKFYFFLGGAITAALISNLVLKINGQERFRWKTFAHLQARNAYNVGTAAAQAFVMDFTNRFAKDETAMTLATYAATAEAGVQDMVLEFDLGSYVATPTSTVTIRAEVDVPSANRTILRNRYYQKVLAGAVEEQVIIPYGQNGEQLQRMYIFGTTSLIDNIRIRREGADEFEDMSVVDNEFIARDMGKLPQAGMVCVDFIQNNLVAHMLNTAVLLGSDGKPRPIQNLDIRFRTNAAGTFDIYTESVCLNDRA